MATALYRKYRPQTFEEVTGQNHIKITLQHEIESGNISHAYIFSGPRGVGKTTCARLLAKAINCMERKQGTSEPCGTCDSCVALVAGNDLDVMEIDAASHTGVDNVRENIIQNARFTPSKRPYKVFIIDEVHMLSISAFNALLKLLEEPPAHALFILCTTETHKIPATIVSRCQNFYFKKVNATDMVARLSFIASREGVQIDNEVFQAIARHSEGCIRDAESLLGQVFAIGDKKITKEQASLIIPQTNYERVVDLLKALSVKNTQEGIRVINSVMDEGTDLTQFTNDVIEFLRKMLVTKIGGGMQGYVPDFEKSIEEEIIKLASAFPEMNLVKLIELFVEKRQELKVAVIPQLPLEIAICIYCLGSADVQNRPQPPPPADKGGTGGTPLPTGHTPNPASPKQEPLTSRSAPAEQTRDIPSVGEIKTTITDIRNAWHQFLVKVQDINASLTFILKVAEPLRIEGNSVHIGLKYPFHRDRLMEPKIKQSLEEGLFLFFNDRLYIEPILLDKGYKSDFISRETQGDEVEFVQDVPSVAGTSGEEVTVERLVEIFGGKLVE